MRLCSSEKDNSDPVMVTGITDAILVEPGPGHTCILLSNRTVQCWGDDEYGQLGDGTNTDATTPVTVSGL